MRVNCPFTFKALITSIIVFWFLIRGTQLYLRMHRPDYKVDQHGLISHQPFEKVNAGMYLRKIQNRFKMQNFELIEMMNETNPNIISDDAILIISASHSLVDHSYAHLLEKIQLSNNGSSRLPFYLLRKAKSLLMQNYKEIKNQVDEIVKVLEYFTEFLLIKKLTVLSFEQGSLLSLRALSLMKYDVFSIIDKFILINPFNPTIMIFHGNAASFLQQTKQKILSDPVRTQLTNGTRIIIIHTIDNNPGDMRLNWLFRNTQGELITFANTLVVQSKLMWNVYSYLKPQEYFRFQPFLEILTKLFNQDRDNGPLSVTAIKYLLYYRELPHVRQLSVQNRNKILSKCIDYYLQNYSLSSGYFNIECIRVLRKQDFYFNENTTVIVRSQGKFQLYGENYEKLVPYDTTKQTMFLLENVQEYRRFFIINRRRYPIQFTVQAILRPEILRLDWDHNQSAFNDILVNPKDFKMITYTGMHPVMMCPGYTILFPINFLSMLYGDYFHQIMSDFSIENNGHCYLGFESYLSLFRSFIKNWSLGCNLIIFSLFCNHVLKRSVFSRFYYQLVVNNILTYIHTGGQLLISQNLIVLSIVVLIEQSLKLIIFISDVTYMPKNMAIKVMWIPLAFQVLRWIDSYIFFSPWKALGLFFLAGTHKNNISILFLETIFIMQYIIRDISNTQGLFLCCAWLTLSSFQEQQRDRIKQQSNNSTDIVVITIGRKLKTSIKSTILKLRKEIVDTVTICIVAMCLSEDGVVMHFIVDFYIGAHIIFMVHQQMDDLT